MITVDGKNYYRSKEVARLFQVSLTRIQHLRERRRIPTIRHKKYGLLYPQKEIDEFAQMRSLQQAEEARKGVLEYVQYGNFRFTSEELERYKKIRLTKGGNDNE